MSDDLSFLDGVAAATIYEANGKRGAVGPSVRAMLAPSPPVYGSAVTVLCWPGDALGLWQALETASPGTILVADMGGTDAVTGFGSGTVKAALAKGVRAIVANVSLRDLAEIRELNLPVFAAGINLRGTHRNVAGELSVPVSLGDAVCHPGDVVVADDDGVTFVARADIAALRRALPMQISRERETDRMLSRGEFRHMHARVRPT